MLFQMVVVPLCPFSSMLFYILPLLKNLVGSMSIPCLPVVETERWRKAACHETTGKNRGWREVLSYSQPVLTVMVKVKLHAKQNLKFSSEHCSSHSHRSHFGLVKLIFAKGFFSQDLSLMILAAETLEGTWNKTFGFWDWAVSKWSSCSTCAHQTALKQGLLGDVKENIRKNTSNSSRQSCIS